MEVQKNVELSNYTYYQIGGTARFFIEAKSVAEVKKAIEFAAEPLLGNKSLPVFILGGGTNVLVSDDGFNGLVVKCQMSKVKCQRSMIVAGAGVPLQKVVNLALDNNLRGLEWAAGIPGTVGGAVRGNAGAFGHSISDIVKEVKVILTRNLTEEEHGTPTPSQSPPPLRGGGEKVGEGDSSAKFRGLNSVKFRGNQMEFDYRNSVIKEEGGIILEVILELERVSDQEVKKLRKQADNHLDYRKKHQPLEYPSCGSTFKNIFLKALNNAEINPEPELSHGSGHGADKRRKLLSQIREGKIAPYPLSVSPSPRGRGRKSGGGVMSGKISDDSCIKIPAARLIEACGLKGKKVGGARISKKHANFIVNLGKATAADVYQLIKLARRKVKEEFGVKLELEVELVGFKR